jgi:hypothetical protein
LNVVVDFDWLIVNSVLVAVGIIGNSYAHYARSRGWPAGRWFSGGISDKFTFVNASVIFVPLAAGMVWYRNGWQYALGVLAAGWIIAWLATISLRQYVQVFWFVAFAGAIIYGVATNAHKFL